MNIESLKAVFGDCKYVSCACKTKSSYVSISSREIFIYDEKDENPVQIAESDQLFQLKVLNPNSQEICIIKTDHCLFTDQTKKCDCVIFDTSLCYFVEIKTGKNRNELRKTAVKQLATTILVFKDKNIDLSNHATKAVICFKNGVSRPIQASFNSQRANFLSEYNIHLVEGNQISFQKNQ